MKNKSSLNNPLPLQYHLETFMDKAKVSKSSLARALKVNPSTITRLLKEEILLNLEMALYLESISGKKAETWLNYQTKYNLFKLRNKQRLELANPL